jgi:DNA recombination protein Rad52
MDWDRIKPLLDAKLDPAHVKKGGGQYGPKGDYIEGWHAIAEANRIFGHGGWSYTIDLRQDDLREVTTQKGPQWQAAYTCICTVTVGGTVRQDVGFGSGFAKGVGDAIEGATKEAATDALKRALRTFGNPFGLPLYDKRKENVGRPGDDDAPPPPKAPPKLSEQAAPTAPTAPKRDPAKIADAMIAKVGGAPDMDALNALLGGRKFDEAWEWLSVNAPDHGARVKAAVEAARDRLGPPPSLPPGLAAYDDLDGVM